MKKMIITLSAMSLAFGVMATQAQALSWSDPFEGSQYSLVFDDGVSWDASKEVAKAEGGWLATITSAGEKAFIETLLNFDAGLNTLRYSGTVAETGYVYKSGYWIGGTATPPGSKIYMWENGEGLVGANGFTDWVGLEPNGTRDTHMAIHKVSEDGGSFATGWVDDRAFYDPLYTG